MGERGQGREVGSRGRRGIYWCLIRFQDLSRCPEPDDEVKVNEPKTSLYTPAPFYPQCLEQPVNGRLSPGDMHMVCIPDATR